MAFEEVTRDVTLAQATRVWARIGLLSFGGPAGQIALMHRELVEQRGWIDEARFLHALNFCMLLPGPEAMQLATYVGWLKHGVRGGLVAGGLFVLPGVVAIMALSWLYVLAGDVGWVQGVFFGLKAAVLAIVAQALVKIAGRALKNRALGGVAVLAFVLIYALHVPFPAIVALAALGGWLATRAGWHPDGAVAVQAPAPRARVFPTVLVWAGLWLVPVLALWALLGADHVLARVALYFSQMAVVTFGGAYAVLAWVAQAAVQDFGWLSGAQMIDGLAMAETTPGPLIMVTQFVGFMAGWSQPGALPPLVMATLAGLVTTWVTFAPCFLWIFAGAPYAERLRAHAGLRGALAGVTAAVVGVIANLALWFALRVLFAQVQALALGPVVVDVPVWSSLDPVALGLTVLALVAAFVLRWGLGALLAGAVVLGALAQTLGMA